MTLHLLNDVVNDIESDTQVLIASLKSEPTCKLIDRILGSHLLISSLPSSTFLPR